mmetsp:Transcript_52502/g.122857  ORF Transcript_52502/g.122857 Transcript_52502/m.122857 type:complete len:243 (+) Transcript_52502:1015-1743(+)
MEALAFKERFLLLCAAHQASPLQDQRHCGSIDEQHQSCRATHMEHYPGSSLSGGCWVTISNDCHQQSNGAAHSCPNDDATLAPRDGLSHHLQRHPEDRKHERASSHAAEVEAQQSKKIVDAENVVDLSIDYNSAKDKSCKHEDHSVADKVNHVPNGVHCLTVKEAGPSIGGKDITCSHQCENATRLQLLLRYEERCISAKERNDDLAHNVAWVVRATGSDAQEPYCTVTKDCSEDGADSHHA